MPIDQFAKEMQELAAQAALVPPAELGPVDPPKNSEIANAVGKALQPLAEGLESVRSGVAESNRVLARLAKEIESAEGAAGTEDPAARITRTLDAIQSQVQRMGQVESANLRLFDALHAELKGYKDNFLFDALQKPFVRDLITLSDDLGVVQQQIEKRFESLPETSGPERDFLSKLTMNLENTLAHFYEVLVRMEVEPYESAEGAAVDLKRHRALSVEPAMLPDHDGRIVRSLKQGFLWRERVIRPEEVVVCKWPGSKEPSGE
jgi:molecular chaperone GrpE (heat shock protein)